MKRHLSHSLVCLLTYVLVIPLTEAQNDSWNTIEFETTEVTRADVTLSPDGQWLIFTMLGHLFRLPVEGDTAEQLTFGPYYDNDPVFSPDGARVAFVSDRDGSESDVFVLELATREIKQVTHEPRAVRPTWTPDGQAIVYLRLVPEAAHRWRSHWGPIPSLVRRVALNGGEPETLSAQPREIRSLFYMPDGRLAWTVLEREPGSPRVTTRIEVISPQGRLSTLCRFEGIGDRVVASPTGDGLYCRRVLPLYRYAAPEHLVFIPFPECGEQFIIPVSGSGHGWGGSRWYWGPRFAVTTDNKTLYVGDAGRLWKIILSSGVREPILFRASIKLEIQDPVPPPQWAAPVAGSSAPPRMLTPKLSLDRQTLVFGAAGYLWQQPLDNRLAHRLFEGRGKETDASFSPDGKRLAFVHSEYGKSEIRVFDFESRKTRSLLTAEDPEDLSWSPDGQQIAFYDGDEEIKVLDLASGQVRTVASGDFHPRLSWSADGHQLIFCDHDEYRSHSVVAINLSDGTRKVLADKLHRDVGDVQLSADGQTLYFSTKAGGVEIWAAPLGSESVKEEDIRQPSPEGGGHYTFTSDGSALIYSVGNRIWLQPLDGGEREEIPVRLELQRPTPPPLLVRRVRVLNFTTGGFGPETSLFIEQGRIHWIGSERGRQLPPETETLDAGGRFAIPGLFDMHVHPRGSPAAYMAYGITSVRDVGGSLNWMNIMADRSETTGDHVPRNFYTGEAFEGRQLKGTGWVELDSEEDARSYVREWKARGAHFIKVHHPITWVLQRAVAEEARRLGLPVIGHGMIVEEVTKSLTLGYWTLEHFMGQPYYDDVFQMMALAGTRWDPTLSVAVGHPLLRNEPERLFDTKFRAFNSEESIRQAQKNSLLRAAGDRMLEGFWAEQLAGIRAAYRWGVKLLVGTDAGGFDAFPAVSLHWELEHFVQAGIPPMEVLRFATQGGAAAVGADKDLGTLEPGKLADIVLLDANPLEDIKNTQTIWRVIKGGWVFDPEELRPVASKRNTRD